MGSQIQYNGDPKRNSLPYQEKRLVDYLDQLISESQEVTPYLISATAIEFYYEPNHLAQKAAISYLIQNRNTFQYSNGYLDPAHNDLVQSFIKMATDCPSKIINDCGVRSFSASRTWVKIFMDNHRYSFRKPHYPRRSAVNQKFVDKYLADLSHAIEEHGRKRVLNMDETKIMLNDFSYKTIAKKGQKEVSVFKDSNDTKASTTYIGTIAMDPSKRFPLYCVAKGKTDGCERKYENESSDDCFMDHTEDGWTDKELMVRYLDWLSGIMEKKPFTLVLDVYPAHLTIQEYAEKLNISLLFVPANGTGDYQPLDRRIFGIIKKKLGSTEYQMQNAHVEKKEGFAVKHQQLKKAWESLSDEAIFAAWNIPGLELPDEEEEIGIKESVE